jgi:ectoine hydroxylase-related dioxygenase (phytanoyl-CoA dioxygenase family)
VSTARIRAVFEEAGYWVGPPMLSPAEVAETITHFDAVLAGRYETGRAPQGVGRFGTAMTKVSNAWWADDVIRARVLDPRLGAIAAGLLDVDEVYLWADSLYWKAPDTNTEQARVGWHQDKQYWAVSSTDKMITACLSLYDADHVSGGLRFARGSHRWGLVGGSHALVGNENAGVHPYPPTPVGETWVEECPRLVPGQATFHHALTFHASGPNRTSAPRRSLTVHYVAGEGRLVRWDPVDDGYLATVGLGNPFRGHFFPRAWPPEERT